MLGLQMGMATHAWAQEESKPSAGDSSNLAASSAPDYPLSGKLAEIKFGETLILLNFKDAKTLSIVGTSGVFKGVTETVSYTAIKIRPQVYMVYWAEPVSKLNVVHVEDFEHGVVYTNVSYPDQSFLHLKGSIRVLGDAT